MPPPRHAAPPHGSRPIHPRLWIAALALLALASALTRMHFFHDPLVDGDEEFYLLMGDRMLSGLRPYLDLWDRKPVGLFLLYAGIRLLGGNGILAYQLVATGFVATTAMTIAVIARRIASPGAAVISALLYIVLLPTCGGQGGQSPVFYNLPMALAGWLIVRSGDAGTRTLRRRGAAAMLLVGLAMQIKYSPLIEGVYFGAVLGWLRWRRDPRLLPLLGDMALWSGLALAPTVAALLYYAGIGETWTFVYANFVSIGQRGEYGRQKAALLRALARLLPVLVPIACRPLLQRSARAPADDPASRILWGWAGAAVLSFAVFGSYFNHYVLPLFVPLTIVAAPAFRIFGRNRAGAVVAALSLCGAAYLYRLETIRFLEFRGDADHARQVTAAIAAHRGQGSLYIFYGEPIYYLLSGSPLPTRWAFPYHLSLRRELPALGVDAPGELRRILDSHPSVILDVQTVDTERDAGMAAILREHLARDYHLIGWFPRRDDIDLLWALNRPQTAQPSPTRAVAP